MIEGDSVLIKYNEIRNKIKRTLNIKFNSMPIDDEKYVKTKVKEFNGVVNTNFCGDKVPKERGVHSTCITRISIDCFMKMEKKKNYPQHY